MKKVGKLWIEDNDEFFARVLRRTGDKFEDDHLHFALQYVTDWSLALDVGAHYGSWTRILATKFDRVVAVEGSPGNFECLKLNTEHLTNVELVNKAVGDRYDNVNIGFLPQQPKTNSGGKAVIGSGTIPMIPFDSLKLPSLGFLKMDIEGYEIFAIQGGIETIMKYKPVMVVEDNTRNKQHGFDVGQTVEFIKTLGAKHIQKFKGGNNVFVWE
jgi:FkbM family methyltransferase